MKFLKLFFSFGLPFGIGMGLYFGLAYGSLYGLFGGIASGVLFGFCMAFITLRRNKKYQVLKELFFSADEVVFDSYANRIAGFFPTEGRLFLTKTSLVFMKVGGNNTVAQKFEFPLNAIQDIKTCRHRLNLNAISFLMDGREEKFIFSNVDKDMFVNNAIWVELIKTEIWKNQTNFGNDEINRHN